MNDGIPELIDTRTAAAVLGLSARTLEGLRVRGGGPRFRKLGPGPRASVRYAVDDVRAWLDRQSRASTADGPAVG